MRVVERGRPGGEGERGRCPTRDRAQPSRPRARAPSSVAMRTIRSGGTAGNSRCSAAASSSRSSDSALARLSVPRAQTDAGREQSRHGRAAHAQGPVAARAERRRPRRARPAARGRPRRPARSARRPCPRRSAPRRPGSATGLLPAPANATCPSPRRSRNARHSPSPRGQEAPTPRATPRGGWRRARRAGAIRRSSAGETECGACAASRTSTSARAGGRPTLEPSSGVGQDRSAPRPGPSRCSSWKTTARSERRRQGRPTSAACSTRRRPPPCPPPPASRMPRAMPASTSASGAPGRAATSGSTQGTKPPAGVDAAAPGATARGGSAR